MIVFVSNNTFIVIVLIFIAIGVLTLIFKLASSANHSVEMTSAKQADDSAASELRTNVRLGLQSLIKKTYPESVGSEQFNFPNDDRLEKFILTLLLRYKVGIFDKRQIVGHTPNDIEHYVVNRRNAYVV